MEKAFILIILLLSTLLIASCISGKPFESSWSNEHPGYHYDSTHSIGCYTYGFSISCISDFKRGDLEPEWK